MKNIALRFLLFAITAVVFWQCRLDAQKPSPHVEIYQLFELNIDNEKKYSDHFRDVELQVELTNPDGHKLMHYGFYDGDKGWKVRFSPDKQGEWRYKASFSDQSEEVTGSFNCISSDKPGRVMKHLANPFWMGKGGEEKTLFRSLHVGDRFFAENWDDPSSDADGNPRTKFLDWLQENKYNMLSIASHYTNRDQEGRGRGWDTPKLWPLDVGEFRKMETILDELKERDITVFPFAGLFGVSGSWPSDHKEQELYIKYTLARIGHYPNIILSVSGPEPLIHGNQERMKGAMRFNDILRLGKLIDSLDVHDHILTVHNETPATEYGDLFVDEPWYSLSTLQGPKTIVSDKLYSGLSLTRHRHKPAYAQETLWSRNKYHPQYTDDQLRKNTYAILFSGSILCFGDMNGDSSSGFTGSLDPDDCFKERHDMLNVIWDWFETIPFHEMTSRHDLVGNGGFCLANEGHEYYVYLESKGKVNLFLDYPITFRSEWINAKNHKDKRPGPSVDKQHVFSSPDDGDDWILHVYDPAKGS